MKFTNMDVPMVDHAFAQYKCDAASAIKLKLVKNENDVFDKGKDFSPEFTHQFFGDSETIFGYQNLKVQLYYHAGSLLTYLGMTFDSKVDDKNTDGVEPDNVIKMIADKLPEGYSFLTNLDDFISKLPGEASFKPMGELLHTYQRGDIDYEIYKVDMSVPRFRDYHSKLQTFLLWFIDGASYIDVDDDKWSYFVVFEKRKLAGNVEYSVVGYMTVYHYYAYPDKVRPRISQMLILPPYQKCGHGACLIRLVDNFFIKDPKVLDITVEDPSVNFIRLRDFVDASECIKLQAFSAEKLKKGFSKEMMKEGQEKRKINKRQCRRVYEILRLRATDRSNPQEYKDYRLDVKKRLNIPFQKEKSDIMKLSRVLSPDELAATMAVQSEHDLKQRLELMYRDLEQSYLGTIERLAAY